MVNLGIFDLQNLAEELEKKYGLDEKTSNPSLGTFWVFGGQREINLSAFNGKITLVYSCDDLLANFQEKQNQKKGSQFIEATKGI